MEDGSEQMEDAVETVAGAFEPPVAPAAEKEDRRMRMTRKECLDAAAKCVLQDRNSSYGGPEDSFGVISNFWSVYLGRKVCPHDVAMMMALLKIARIKGNKGYADGYVDLAGYAACGAECGCFQNGNSQSETKEEPKFMPGDRIQVQVPTAHGCRWDDAVCVSVLPDGTGIRVDYREYRGIAFGWPFVRHAPKADEEPKFKTGDKVQYRVELPSVSDSLWRDATYLRPAFSWQQDGEHIVTDEGLGPVTVKDKDIRLAPKAEGCKELVQEEPEPEFNPRDRVQAKMGDGKWRDAFVSGKEIVSGKLHYTVSIHGFDGYYSFPAEDIRPVPRAEGCEELVQKDAPQTKEELYDRIVASNPVTFHTPSYAEEQLEHHSRLQARKPTGEELAEMAEEEAHE